MNDLYLAHHGIKGMKWGVRRTPEQLGHKRLKRFGNWIKRSSGTRMSKTLHDARREDINKLSNQQLKDYNERLSLERNFAQLTEGKVKQGKDWIAKTIITGIVVGSVSTVTKAVVQRWLKERFGLETDSGKK